MNASEHVLVATNDAHNRLVRSGHLRRDIQRHVDVAFEV